MRAPIAARREAVAFPIAPMPPAITTLRASRRDEGAKGVALMAAVASGCAAFPAASRNRTGGASRPCRRARSCR
mgnify:CR=1 FL=1